MTLEERFAQRSAHGRANAKAQFEKHGYHIPPWACRIGGFITIHNRFHQDKTFENCPVCNGTLEELKEEEAKNGPQ
jgi:hypothetical protein